MKSKTNIVRAFLMVMALFAFGSCGQSGKSTDEAKEAETIVADAEEEPSGEHEHHAAIALNSEAATVWKPSGEGVGLIGRDFHFIAGNVDQINPVVLSEDGEGVLQLTTSGEQAAFVFHNKMGNVGIAVTLKQEGYQGTLKIIHHTLNTDTYEFVSINGNSMSQGRIVNGVEKIFDTKNFDSTPGDWMTIRVSAAGSHFKGYLGDKNITHGHGDELEAGYIGIMTEGSGKVAIKSIEVTPLEAE
jgi:hypothetical protein